MPNWLKPDYELAQTQPLGPYLMSGAYKVFYGTGRNPAEGWKFHLSAHPWNAESLARQILPLLRDNNIWHKYLEMYRLAQEQGTAQEGKFIVIYPTSPAHAHEIAAMIKDALYPHYPDGPAVRGEKPFGPTGILYTRYGSFQAEYIRGPEGETKSMDPPRGRRPYHKGTYRPTWIPDLQMNDSPEPFPSYDVRRQLHFWKECDAEWTD